MPNNSHTQRPVDKSWDVRSLWKQLFCCSSRRAMSSLWMFFLHCTCEHVFRFFSVPDLSFFFSLSFFQKDLPLPRKNSRWVLSPFIPPSLYFLLALLGETGSFHDENQSHREMLPTVILHIVFRKLRGGLSGACGVECVAFMWRGGGRAGGMLGVCWCLIKASRELWMLSMVLKAILPFPVAQSLAPYLPFSSPSAWL